MVLGHAGRDLSDRGPLFVLLRIAGIVEQHGELDAPVPKLREVRFRRVSGIEGGSRVVRRKEYERVQVRLQRR